jgi:hypothetical protein
MLRKVKYEPNVKLKAIYGKYTCVPKRMSIRLGSIADSMDSSMSGSGHDITSETFNASQFAIIYILAGGLVIIMMLIAVKVMLEEHQFMQAERRRENASTMSTCYSSPSYIDRPSDIEFVLDLPSP